MQSSTVMFHGTLVRLRWVQKVSHSFFYIGLTCRRLVCMCVVNISCSYNGHWRDLWKSYTLYSYEPLKHDAQDTGSRQSLQFGPGQASATVGPVPGRIAPVNTRKNSESQYFEESLPSYCCFDIRPILWKYVNAFQTVSDMRITFNCHRCRVWLTIPTNIIFSCGHHVGMTAWNSKLPQVSTSRDYKDPDENIIRYLQWLSRLIPWCDNAIFGSKKASKRKG